MLSRIGVVENIPVFLKGVKEKKEKMFGFGHRVYRNFDPRAGVIQKIAEEVFSLVGKDPLIDVAVALESAARNDSYFVERKLYPNVDFYSGLVYRALGFPPRVLHRVVRGAKSHRVLGALEREFKRPGRENNEAAAGVPGTAGLYGFPKSGDAAFTAPR